MIEKRNQPDGATALMCSVCDDSVRIWVCPATHLRFAALVYKGVVFAHARVQPAWSVVLCPQPQPSKPVHGTALTQPLALLVQLKTPACLQASRSQKLPCCTHANVLAIRPCTSAFAVPNTPHLHSHSYLVHCTKQLHNARWTL